MKIYDVTLSPRAQEVARVGGADVMTLEELKRRFRQAKEAEIAWRANISDPDMRQESNYYDDELADAAREALPDLIAAVNCLRACLTDDGYVNDGDHIEAQRILKRLGVE